MSDCEDSKICVGILTVSDRCASGESTDTSGQNLSKLIENGIVPNAKVSASGCVSDDERSIVEALQHWADHLRLHLILTTGGTGFAPRDVTPEAVKQVIDREANGLALLMAVSSLRVTPLAALSRPVCGIRGHTVIVTLPGSAKAAEECLRFLAPVLPHATDLLAGRLTKVADTHESLQALGVQAGLGAAGSHGTSAHGCGGHSHHHRHHQVHHAHSHQQHLAAHHHHHVSHVTHANTCSHTPSSTVGMSESKADVSKVCRRPRKSPYPMISVEQAQQTVLSQAVPKEPVQLPLADAAGFVLAVDVSAASPLPPFPASIKDGYAVLTRDGAGLRKVAGGVTAGDKAGLSGEVGEASPAPLVSGTCVRINTGAPLPAGADAVVQVEDTELTQSSEDGCEELEIKILVAPRVGQDIRPVGCDIAAGQRVLAAGDQLGAAEVGLAAAAGAATVAVYPQPRVGLLSTGNELQSVESGPLEPGRIYDSNLPTLRALLQLQHVPFVEGGAVKDTPKHLLQGLTALLDKGVDVIVTTGGVSMGERDILRAVLEADLGATIHFAQVFMKPGKPTTFASFVYNGNKRLLLGLPGNPVSANVTASLYLLPLCKKLAGQRDCLPTQLQTKLQHRINLDPRPEYHRATLSFSPSESLPLATSTGNQLSSRLLSCASASALLLLPPRTDDQAAVEQGAVVPAILLHH